MKYLGLALIMVNILSDSIAFLISPYEFPIDKKLGDINSDGVLILTIIYGLLSVFNILFIIQRLLEKRRFLRWWGDYVILCFFLFNAIELLRMIFLF